LTPPDVISQILLAIPIWILFEIGLVLGKYFKN
jgi:sec-independent protein translocase protein TatC